MVEISDQFSTVQ